MKTICLALSLTLMLASCVSVSKDASDVGTDKSFTEICYVSQIKYHYSYSWEAEDYAFLNSVYAGKAFTPRSPHGPAPNCDAKYKNTSYSSLKGRLPGLERSTYESFLKKNESIAVHHPSTALVKLDEKAGQSISLPGFSSNKKQVLIYNGLHYQLYNYSDGKWKSVGAFMSWVG